jgi:lipid-A-disaccharide synthase-like uncharacterized protein
MDPSVLAQVAAPAESFMHRVVFDGSFFGHAWSVTPWKLVGYTGTFMFAGRWLVQFLASRKARRTVMPMLFWYMSLCGSMMILSYFIWGKNDSVGILGNLFPAFVALYNIYLEVSHRRRESAAGDGN